jgi:hypothetical protein
MQTRRTLPKEFPVILTYQDGRKEKLMVPAAIHPATLVLLQFGDLPGLLSGREPDENYRFRPIPWMRLNDAFEEFARSRGAVSAGVEAPIDPEKLSRVLAKIAHGFAIAKLGLNGFTPLLLDLIHGRVVANAPELVGSDPNTPPPATGVVHELALVPHEKLVVVRIRLLASSSINGEHAMPVYLAVAGTKLT